MIPFASRRLAVLFAAGLVCRLVAAEPTVSTSPEWYARSWQTEDGLPDNNVDGIAQTPDGFLWIATSHGLVRFDGANFGEISSTNFIQPPNGGIMALRRSRSGGLWLEMDRGAVVKLDEGRSETATPETNGLPDLIAQSLVEDNDGTLWISYLGGAVCFLKDGKATVLTTQQNLPWGPLSSIAKDTKGRIWLARDGQVGIFRDNRFQPLVHVSNHLVRLAAARDGGIWICSGSQLFWLDEGTTLKPIGTFPTPDPRVEPSVLLEDSRGAVWAGTAYNGLYRFDGSGFEKVPTSHPQISSLLEDHEGNIWVGTHGGGLNRLRPRAITLEGIASGLPFEGVQSICQDTNGTLWAVTGNGLLVRRDAQGWSTISTNADWPGGIATCVAADPDGAIWIGTRNHRLIRRQNGRYEALSKSRGVEASPTFALLADRDGNLWIGGVNHTLQYFHAGEFYTVPMETDARTVRAIAQDTAGRIWVGTSKGLLLRINGVQAVDETAQTLGAPESIRCLCAAPDGSLWIGYAGYGLGRLKDGRFSQITAAQGLFDDYISQIVPDGRGWFWFGSDRGIFKVHGEELAAAAENPNAHIRSIHYGRGEGLPSLQASFGYVSGGIRSRDGRLWIPTRSALAVVDPEKLSGSPPPPPVLVTRVAVDDKDVAVYGEPTAVHDAIDLRKPVGFQLPPEHRKLEFDFTALSFSAPENVRLQYRLEGFDDGWLDAGTERNARYPRLPAGNYQFRLRACNGDGVWSDAGTSLAFTVTPFLWQRWWFLPLAFVLFGAGVIVVVRYISFRRLRSRLRVLEQQAALDRERARIARDLHDDLGSHLTRIVLLSDLMLDYQNQPEKSGATARRVSTTARRVIKALDETVWAVNPRNDTLAHLIDYIGQFAVEFLRTAGIRCHADLPLRVPEKTVSTEVRHNLFLVVKEALNNVVNHAGAGEVRLRIGLDERSIRLVIEDNGRGFSQAPDNGHADGLRNMRQRVEEVGGRFELESKPLTGTRIAVTAPLNK